MPRLKPDPVPAALIRKILEAGVSAPSGENMQRRRFLVVLDAKVKQTIGAYYKRAWDEVVAPRHGAGGPAPGTTPERFKRMLDAAHYPCRPHSGCSGVGRPLPRRNSVPPPTYVKAAGFTGRVDRWQEFEFVAPSSVLQWTGAADVGTGAYEGKGDGGFQFRLFHGLTPETETSCFYFWSVANGYRPQRARPRKPAPTCNSLILLCSRRNFTRRFPALSVAP
jgi:hypothetical protein